jgi:hypothetical protein
MLNTFAIILVTPVAIFISYCAIWAIVHMWLIFVNVSASKY